MSDDKFKLIEATEGFVFDWKKCVLCQKDGKEALLCPAQQNRLERAKKRANARQLECVSDVPVPTKKFTRSYTESSTVSAPTTKCLSLVEKGVCFFCENEFDLTETHVVSTFAVDLRVRQCAFNLQDQKLIAKLSGGGDLIAHDVPSISQ